MNDAPHALQHRSIFVPGRGCPRADFWRTGNSVIVVRGPARLRHARALSGCPGQSAQ